MNRHIFILSLLTGLGFAAPVDDRSLRGPGLLKRGTSTTSVVTTLAQGIEWLIPIQIANKTFNVQLDTGSADLWLFCDGAKVGSGHDLYNPSTGTKLDGSSFDVKYGSGYAKGDVYMDRVTTGSITANQAVGCATSVDANDAADHGLDGIMGVGFNSGSKSVNNGHPQSPSATKSALNAVSTKSGGFLGLFRWGHPDPQMTFIENAYPQLAEGLFTADLNYKQKGVYNFGYIDQARFSTPITYMPVRNWNYWIVETSGYAIGTNASKSDSWKVLIDSGTTNLLLPPAATLEYFSAVPSAKLVSTGNYLVPCDPAAAKLPNLTITFTPPQPVSTLVQPGGSGGISTKPYQAVIPGEYIIGNPTGNNDGMCHAGINNAGSGQAWDAILGDVFMMSQLVVFDLGDENGSVDSKYPSHGQIGFAPKPVGNSSQV